MKKKLLLLPLLLLILIPLFLCGVSAQASEIAVEATAQGCDFTVTLTESNENYTYNEDAVTLKEGVLGVDTSLVFTCRKDLSAGTYELLYLDGAPIASFTVYAPGDTNMDGKVSALDVLLVKQSIVGMTTLSPAQSVYADVYDDGTGRVNAFDAMLVLQYIVGMDVKFGHTHPLTHHEENPASCTEAGNIEYYSCSVCEKFYTDAEAKNEIALADTHIPPMHAGGTELRNEIPATEHTDGYSGDLYCLGCGELLSVGHTLPHTSRSPVIRVSEAVWEEDSLRVVISLANNPGIVSLKFGLLYDPALSIRSVSFGEPFDACVTAPEPYINPQTFNWITSGENVSVNGVFATVIFSLNAPVTEERVLEISLLPDGANIFDYTFRPVVFDAVGATVTVRP